VYIPTNNVFVVCTDGPFGYLDGITLNQVTNEITHLVVQEDAFLGVKRLVPIDEVVKSTFRYLLLCCTRHELAEFDAFADVEFVPVEDPYDYAYDLPDLEERTLYSWPYATSEPGYIPVEHPHIPANELVIRGNAQVFATDGKVGFLDKFIIEAENHKITDLVIRVGSFWGYKDIAIPLAQVDQIKDDSVHLKLSETMIDALPVLAPRSEKTLESVGCSM
jgi:sporulation protein YlmC with PRC-barrel domain